MRRFITAMLHTFVFFSVSFLFFAPYANTEEKTEWSYVLKTELPPRKAGEEPRHGEVRLWIPQNGKRLKGIILTGSISLEGKLVRDEKIRSVAGELNLAIVQMAPSVGLFDRKEHVEKFREILIQLAAQSGRSELPELPYVTIGHSTGGIYARNIGYWFPDRTIAIIHLKSGNLHHSIPDPQMSLKGIPFLAINGELEEFGPEGGGRKGIREKYGLQTQWIMIRKQLLWLRRKDPQHLVSLIVEPDGTHTSWNENLTDYCAMFIRKAVMARIPQNMPLSTSPACQVIRLEEGWLSDANIKAPRHKPAPYKEYGGDKINAFWHLDGELAEAASRIHQQLRHPDPSLDESWWEPPAELIPRYSW